MLRNGRLSLRPPVTTRMLPPRSTTNSRLRSPFGAVTKVGELKLPTFLRRTPRALAASLRPCAGDTRRVVLDEALPLSSLQPTISAMSAARPATTARGVVIRTELQARNPGVRALVTGATGFVGGRLVDALRADGAEVRALVRDAGRARDLDAELHEGDVLKPDTLAGAGRDVDVAYYLVHSMGRGGDGDFAERERTAARAFAEMARSEGVDRVVYLGGLGEDPQSQHLRSRQQTAELLAELGPPLTYFRAAMVVGSASESFRTLRYLVERLPAMIAPAWLKTPTQPIGVDDVIAYLAQAPHVPESAGREVQIGGPDVLSYGDMLDLMAYALGREPRPKVPVPFVSPKLSSLWIGLVTPVDAGVARPLVEGLSTPTTVTDHSGMDLFDIEPRPLADALKLALAEA